MLEAPEIAASGKAPAILRPVIPRIVPQLDTDARLVAFVQRPIGRVILTVSMMALSFWSDLQILAVASAAIVAFLPKWRSGSMLLGTFISLTLGAIPLGGVFDRLSPVTATILFAATAGLLAIAERVGRHGPFARPAFSLVSLELMLAAIGCITKLPEGLRNVIWSCAIVLASFKWFLAYAVVNATSRTPQSLLRHLGMLHPFWGSTSTPFGKGAAFISKFEAKSSEELAVTQLKGLKLMIWAMLLQITAISFSLLAHGYLQIPPLDQEIRGYATGQLPGHLQAIASIPVHFVDSLLNLAAIGHRIIATARFAGFRLPRNTYRPLEANSISEFWNRYYYYFKELLVDFFFMPVFARLTGWPPLPRLICSTFCAAGFGNYLFHFTRDIHLLRSLGPAAAIYGSSTYAFYCFLLATGISCSQLMATRCRGAHYRLPRLARRMLVLLFFCLVSIFDDEGRALSLGEHMHFFLYVLGFSS